MLNVLLNIRMKYDFIRIVPCTQATQATLCCLWRIVTAQAGIAPSDACWFTHTWNRAAWGYVFLIPTSGRRLGITGGRCLPLAFRHSGTHTHGCHAPTLLDGCVCRSVVICYWIRVHTGIDRLLYVFI